MGRRFMTRADLPLRAATRMSGRVRIAYVSYIPPAKAAELAARQEQRAAQLQAQIEAKTAGALRIAPPRRIILTDVSGGLTSAPVVATAAPAVAPAAIQIARSTPDGRVHAQIAPGS